MQRILLVVMATLLVGGCGGDARRELLVSAAASLTDAFTVVAAEYEAEHPDVDIVLNLGGSSALREQILSGAPVDVFASANRANIDEVASAGLVAGPVIDFASNQITIAVPAGNPAEVRGIQDLARDDLLIGLCSPAVPCGEYAEQALAIAGVAAVPDTLEPDVRALLTKISVGELDAGIVYATDVVAAGDSVDAVSIVSAATFAVRYSIAPIVGGANQADAAAFIDFVQGPDGRRILHSLGFTTP